MTILETERLVGRPPRDDRDYIGLRLIHGDPRAMATLSVDGRPFPECRSRAMVLRSRAHFRYLGFGPWFWYENVSGEFVGYCGLASSLIDGAPMIELLYGLRPKFWRRGLASEAARACVDAAFEDHGLQVLACISLPHNHGSRGVMEKVGFVFERPARHYGLPVVLYRLYRSAWAARKTS